MATDRPNGRRMARREVLRLAALAPAAGLVLTACGRDEPALIEIGSEDTGSDVFDVGDLQTLLDRRAVAQLKGDEDAYLTDLDPSNVDMIDREKLAFANLQQFDVADIRYVTGQVGKVGGYEPPPHPFEEQSGPYDFMPVTKVVKLTADDGPDGVLGPGESFEYVVDKRDGAWVVTDIVPIGLAEFERREEEDAALGLASGVNVLPANAPWHMDTLRVINVGDKVWLVADDSVGDLERYAAEAEAEVERVEEVWGGRPRFPGHVLFFTRRKKAFARWYEVGLGSDVTGLREGYAVPVSGVRDNGERYAGEYAGARNLIFLPAAEEQGWGPKLVMRHELTHTVTMRAFGTGDSFFLTKPPTWAVEGFANYIMVRGDADLELGQRQTAVNGFTGFLPNSDTFQEGGARTVSANYAVGYTVFRFVERIRDFETAIDFYREVIKWDDGLKWGQYEPFVLKPAFDGVCRSVLDMGSPDFLDQWIAFVQAGA